MENDKIDKSLNLYILPEANDNLPRISRRNNIFLPLRYHGLFSCSRPVA